MSNGKVSLFSLGCILKIFLPAIPAPFQAYPAFCMMAAAPSPTRTHPHTIFSAESVAVSLKGKKPVGWMDMLSSKGVLLCIVAAEIIDFDCIRGLELLIMSALVLGDVIVNAILNKYLYRYSYCSFVCLFVSPQNTGVR